MGISNINGSKFNVNTNFSNFGNNCTTSSVTKLNTMPLNDIASYTSNISKASNAQNSNFEVEEVNVFDDVKEFFSDIYKRIFDRENYNIEHLECDDITKEELKKQNEIIENLNKQIDEIEGQIKTQQHIIDSAQKSSLSVNDSNYSIAGTSFSLDDVTTANNKLNDLNQQLTALKQTKMTVCSYYYQNYHLAELQPYDNLLNSEVFKNYTLDEQTETEVKDLVGNDFNYLTEEQYKILNYLYQTSGKNEAKNYYKLLESDLNNLKGMEEAYDMLQKLTVNIDEEYLTNASKEYGIDKEYLKGLSFTDLMDTQKFLESTKEKYPNLTDEQLMEFITSMQKNAKVDDLSLETVANYLGVSVKGLGDGIDTFFSGLLNCFDDGGVMSQNEYASQYILTALSSVDTHLDDTYQISTSIGNMAVPSAVAMAATMATNGLGAGASAEMLASLASKVLFFSSTFGNAKHEKLVSGSDKKTALQSAFLNATSEVCLEYVLGTIPGLGRESNSIIKNLFGEGFEEFIQEYYSSGVDAYLYGTEINFDELNENARKAFIYGCLTSYIMNGAQKTINFTIDGVTKTLNASQIQEAIKEDGTIDYDKLASMMQEKSNNDSIEVLDFERDSLIEQLTETDNINSLDSITIEKAATEFKNMIGKNLSSWIPNNQKACQLYKNLIDACNNANIDLSTIKDNTAILEAMLKYYADAKNLNLEKNTKTFETYRTHGIVHIFDVLTQSINACAAFEQAGIKNLSLRTVMLAAIMHDTGMSGGKQLKLSTDSNGNLVIDTVKIESDGDIYRESHSFNSGVNILNEFKVLRASGYSDIEIAEASLLAFAHSKSNSGLNPLSGNIDGWSFAIQALSKATEGSEFNIINVLEKNGIITSANTVTSNSKIMVKCPDGKVGGYVETYNLSNSWMEKMAYEALTVRIGDALTNNDNAGTNQYGKKITFNSTDYSKQHGIDNIVADIIKSNDFSDLSIAEQEQFLQYNSLSKEEQFSLLKDNLNKIARIESRDLTYEVDSIERGGSQQFVLGENNQTYRVETSNDGDVEVVVSIKDSEAIPFCTLFAIDERAGELNSKGEEIFNKFDKDTSDMKLVIEIDSKTSETVKDLYKQYASYYANDPAKVEVIIREIN